MKILFVSLFFPQQKASHAGGRYVYEVIKELSSRHEITLVTRIDEAELSETASIEPYCRNLYPYTYRTKAERGMWDMFSLMLNYIGFSRYADRIAEQGNFEVIQVEWVEAGLMMKQRQTPMIMDAHDVITKPVERLMKKTGGIRRFAAFLRYICVKAIELRIIKKFRMVFTRSEIDKEYLLSMAPGLNVAVVPHPAGLDITERRFDRQKNLILFLASYKYLRRNVDAALFFYHRVFPLVRKVIPDARFIAAGYGPPDDLKALQTKDPAVTVPGFVNDIDACYKEAAVFVAPILTGGGIIVKILDAMAAATPVVTTPYGNEGIGAVPGRDLLVADDPEGFAAAVVKLLMDPEFASEIGRSGQAFVRANFSRKAVIEKIEEAYEQTVNSEW